MNCLVANNSQPNFSLREWNERMTGISFEKEGIHGRLET